MLLEICAYSLRDAILAAQLGADRIELCADPDGGGVTPSPGTISAARQLLHIPLMVIIRPRRGDFLYSAEELTSMRIDIEFCKRSGVDGVVLGVLDHEGNINRATTAELVALAHPMEVTFHRAFDLTPDPLAALKDVIATGCTRILTSGHRATALLGAGEIRQLALAAAGRIILMPGGSLRSTNLSEIARQTGAREFHSSARTHASPAASSEVPFSETHHLDLTELQALRTIANAL